MHPVKIGTDAVGDGCPCWSIAELGINHNGSMDLAKAMIDVAASVGADAVKFQKRTIDAVYSQDALLTPRKSPFGDTNGDLKRGLEFNLDQYAELGRYAIAKDLVWGASVWDEFAVEELVAICNVRPHFLKIASPTITNKSVTQLCAHAKREFGIPVIMSTGMSTLKEISEAVEIIGKSKLILMHCVSQYPQESLLTNMNIMDTLRAQYGVPVGYSGHELGIDISVHAASRGACCIERHFTLSRHLWGSDQKVSIEPGEFQQMIDKIQHLEAVDGSYDKKLLDVEIPAQRKLRR